MKKAAFHTLGCKVNSYETEAMQQMLEQSGYEIVPFQSVADVYIINTCSVTNIADRKSRQMLHRAKKINPNAVVVAVGCYVQAAKEQLLQDTAVDVVVGNNKKAELADILEEYQAGHQNGGRHVIDIGKTNQYEQLRISKIADHTRAFIKIQDGCNQFCSYCIIPFTRGRIRSREHQDVLNEVKMLVEKGYQEVVLTGIHLSSYGKDRDEENGLLNLIVALNQVGNLKRIRLGSLEPRIITWEFARVLAQLDKVCPHFHLSLQSGCDETLKRMNRHYTAEEYRRHCNILRAVFDRPAITTDVIVGFPGETEAEFEVTKSFVSSIGFSEMHVFKYSPREGTRAASMAGQVAEPEKQSRSEVLIEANGRMAGQYKRMFSGEIGTVLLEELITINGEEYLTGYTKEYLKAAVKAISGMSPGTLVTGRLGQILANGDMELSLL